MESLAYYADQSPITDPGGMIRHLATLPHDLAALRRVARGLVLYYRADDLSAHGIPTTGSRRSTAATPRRCSGAWSSSIGCRVQLVAARLGSRVWWNDRQDDRQKEGAR
jgi:hypothetical protein